MAISVAAKDEVANASDQTITLMVNNEAPAITRASPLSAAKVSGAVTISAAASDPQGMASLVLVEPVGLEDTEPSPAVFRGIWNTVGLPEDLVPIMLRATDVDGNSATHAIAVEIDNLAAGSAIGAVALDTPLRDAVIQAIAYVGGERGVVLGIAEVGEDAFQVALPDNYEGIILLRATGAGANFDDLATGEKVFFTSTDELTVLIDYKPSAAGTKVEDLSVNAITTLATSLAERYMADGLQDRQAIEKAYRLFGKHLERDQEPSGLAIRTTAVADLSASPAADRPHEILMGLFHVGLSRWGADAATGQGMAKTALKAVELLELLKRDLGNAVLDGKGGYGAPIYATPDHLVALAADTLRYELALAVANWLDNVPLADGTLGQNTSSLTSANFSLPGGFFDALSLDTSELFGGDVPEPFDRTGPAITVVASGEVVVAGTATDAIGPVAELSVAVNGATTVTLDMPESSFVVDLAIDCDAIATIVVTARDGVGLQASKELQVACDAQAPTLTLASSVFIQERGLDVYYQNDGASVVYDVASAAQVDLATVEWPITIEKYFNRLDYLPNAGRTEAVQNLPTLRFTVTDPWSGGAGSAPANVVTEYRYLEGGSQKRGWTALSGNALPFSYQFLHADLAASDLATEHELQVRLKDGAGNSRTYSFPFYLDIMSPPLWLGDCASHPELEDYKLGDLTLQAFYDAAQPRVAQAKLRYLLNLPTGTLASKAALNVSFQTGVRSRTTKIIWEKDNGYIADSGGWGPPSTSPGYSTCFEAAIPQACWNGDFHQMGYNKYQNNCIYNHFARNAECLPGHMPNVSYFFEYDGGEGIVDFPTHETRLQVFQGGTEVAEVGGGAYEIRPYWDYGLVLSAVNPDLVYANTLYTWETYLVNTGYGEWEDRYYIKPFSQATRDIRWIDPCSGGGCAQAQRYKSYMMAYLSEHEIVGDRIELSAEHPVLKSSAIALQRSPSCEGEVAYSTSDDRGFAQP